MQHTEMACTEELVTELRCLRCGTSTPYADEAYLCERCGHGTGPSDAGVLDVTYDYSAARRALFGDGRRIRSERRDIFRYRSLLPIARVADLLPVGGTPLASSPRLAPDLGLRELFLKDETRNPTRSLKDRATAIGVSRALERGYRDLCCASAGNAAISLSGFAAHAGLTAHAFVPHDTSHTRLAWLDRLGADIYRSDGDYDRAYDEAEARRADGWYSRNCAFNPLLVEGKKTVAFEIAEQLEWELPDLVVCPVGDACTLAAIGKGFRELLELEVVDRVPRLIGVQTAAVHPVVDVLRAQEGVGPEPLAEGTTRAASINVRHPRNAQRLLGELTRSNGTMLAVTDEQIRHAQSQLALKAGVVAEFTSAATLAGLQALAQRESLSGLSAVLVITGGRPDDA
jgi:threonine synthase